MPALACPPVSDSVFSLPASARRRAGLLAAAVATAVLTACAPMAPNADGAIATTGDALGNSRAGALAGSAQLAHMAPAPTSWLGLGDPARAVQDHLDALELPEVDQQGIASWYGPGFHGRKTANGERFNQYELTAAHRTYKFGTQLCVRSKHTGQAVVVRVNDRGPFVKGRVIDLSKAAAEEIGMLGRGIKAVEIFKLDEGEETCPESVLQAQG